MSRSMNDDSSRPCCHCRTRCIFQPIPKPPGVNFWSPGTTCASPICTTNDDDAAASRLGGAIARRPFVRSREASEATEGRPSDGSRAGRFRRWVGEAQPGRDAQGARRPRVPQVAEHTRMRRCDAVRGRSMGIPKSRGRGRLRSGGCAPHDALREGAGWKVRVPRPSAPRAKQRPSHAQAVRGPLLP